jgi:hypothetical protein
MLDTGTGTQTEPRDGDPGEGTEGSRNASDDAARDGRSDDGDDLDKVDDPVRLREMLRDFRKSERKRNDGYNTTKAERDRYKERLDAIERERSASAPLEDRVKQLEKDLSERDQRIALMEKERKDERTDGDIESAARRLNAADPEDVVRLIDRDELQIGEDGKAGNAEAVVRAFLKRKPHLVKAGGGGADGGSGGSSGRGSGNDMNDILRGARRGGRGTNLRE